MSLPSANVEVSALVKRFRGVEVLRGVDLTFESGRVSALLGASRSSDCSHSHSDAPVLVKV